MRTRIVARAVVLDRGRNAILLVRNKDADYWYIPGGGWEAERENILQCAAREVKEETGLEASIGKFLYLQEFHATADLVVFEAFYLAVAVGDMTLDKNHIDTDPDGVVEEARWFTRDEVADIDIYPAVFKTKFWDDLNDILHGADRFIGANGKTSEERGE